MKDIKGYPRSGKMNVLIYNDENMYYYNGVLVRMDNKPQCITYQSVCDTSARTTLSPYSTMEFEVNNYFEYNENIKLDDTLMKRIAKFNKTQECKRLDKQIEEKQKKINELDNLLKDKEQRWDKVKEYIKNIYDISLEDVQRYDDYDDYAY